jgi:hypothetical protein
MGVDMSHENVYQNYAERDIISRVHGKKRAIESGSDII